MSNLIPTPRTDKNGVTVIRHMKPAVATASAKVLPAVAPPASHSVVTAFTNEEITKIIDPQSTVIGGFDTFLNLLREQNPETIPWIGELLTTGNESGRERVADIFKVALVSVANVRDYTGDGVGWEEEAAEWLSPSLEGTLTRAWAIENSELGGVHDGFRELYGKVQEVHQSHEMRTIKPQPVTSKEYWRGIIALSKSGVPMMDDHRETSRFIQWAGERQDIHAVIILTSQRNTLNVDTLEGILAEQDSTSPVRDGVL